MYLDHFQLTELPFSLTPGRDYHYNAVSQEEAMNVLVFAANAGEGFVKIVGEVGTGKTSLCCRLARTLDPGRFTVLVLSMPFYRRRDLLADIAEQLDVNPEGKKSSRDYARAIFSALKTQQSEGKKTILLCDEAQALPTDSLETLRLLSNFEENDKKLLQVVLLGQQELDEKLGKHELRQVRQRIIFSYDLKPFLLPEVPAYLQHRLKMAGALQEEIFAKDAATLIGRASRGIPRLINILAHKALLVAYGEGAKKVSAKQVQAAIKDTDDTADYEAPIKALSKTMVIARGAGAASGAAAAGYLLTTFLV